MFVFMCMLGREAKVISYKFDDVFLKKFLTLSFFPFLREIWELKFVVDGKRLLDEECSAPFAVYEIDFAPSLPSVLQPI